MKTWTILLWHLISSAFAVSLVVQQDFAHFPKRQSLRSASRYLGRPRVSISGQRLSKTEMDLLLKNRSMKNRISHLPFEFSQSSADIIYSSLQVNRTIPAGSDLQGSFVIINTGNRNLSEVSEIYFSWRNTSPPAPKTKLVWFDRNYVPEAQSVTVPFVIDGSSMALWINNQWEIMPGVMDIYVGGSQPNQPGVLHSNFTVVSQAEKNFY